MEPKEISCAAIHDLSGVGKCSLTVVLPVLSACGVETAALPTAVLSTHTGGFGQVTYRDLTEDMLPMAEHWRRVGCRFSALYSGFLGSAGQIGIVQEIFTMLRGKDTLVFVDPVMGDNGKLYRTYTPEMADGMRELCRRADIIAPNMTEACHILGVPYREGPYSPGDVEEILEKLCQLGPRKAVLTGVFFDDREIGAACRDETGKTAWSLRPRVEGSYHGTGDLFSSALLGGLLNGIDLFEAAALAVEFTQKVIVTTHEESKDYRFGPKFERHLFWLAARIEEFRRLKGL